MAIPENAQCERVNKVYLVQGVVFAVTAVVLLLFALLIHNTGAMVLALFGIFWSVLAVASAPEYRAGK